MSTYPTICLVVIFRNEEDFLAELIDSAGPYIDYAIFLDSSSDDDSRNIISAVISTYVGTKYEIHNFDDPFRGDTKRTRAIELAKDKADYLLVMDADNTLEVLDDNAFDNLELDAYHINKMMGGVKYPLCTLFRGDLEWEYVGVIHDYPQLQGGGPFTCGPALPGVIIHEPVKAAEGRRKKGRMDFLSDALLIETEMIRTKETISPLLLSRYNFYLGQSYKDAQMWDRSITAYRARIKLGGFGEEVFYSYYMIAQILNTINRPKHEVCAAAIEAWNFRPQRWEAAYMLGNIFYEEGWYTAAAAVVGHSINLTCNDALFLEMEFYNKKLPELYVLIQKKINMPG